MPTLYYERILSAGLIISLIKEANMEPENRRLDLEKELTCSVSCDAPSDPHHPRSAVSLCADHEISFARRDEPFLYSLAYANLRGVHRFALRCYISR